MKNTVKSKTLVIYTSEEFGELGTYRAEARVITFGPDRFVVRTESETPTNIYSHYSDFFTKADADDFARRFIAQ